MVLLNIISWVSVIIILLVYLLGSPRQFGWANTLLFIPVCLPALLMGAYSSASISISFGLIAGWKLWRGDES
jgi:uncharacterized membrane protein